jgi:hypothetical protein
MILGIVKNTRISRFPGYIAAAARNSMIVLAAVTNGTSQHARLAAVG